MGCLAVEDLAVQHKAGHGPDATAVSRVSGTPDDVGNHVRMLALFQRLNEPNGLNAGEEVLQHVSWVRKPANSWADYVRSQDSPWP